MAYDTRRRSGIPRPSIDAAPRPEALDVALACGRCRHDAKRDHCLSAVAGGIRARDITARFVKCARHQFQQFAVVGGGRKLHGAYLREAT